VASDLAQAENGVIVFASCTGGHVSLEKPEWQNGALTEALFEALSGKARRDDDRLRVSDIADYVTPRVKQLTGGAQTPVILFPRGRYTNPPVYLLLGAGRHPPLSRWYIIAAISASLNASCAGRSGMSRFCRIVSKRRSMLPPGGTRAARQS
jgi:hypothetical protein